MKEFGTKVYLNTDYQSAVEQVTAALQEEGFGVLTEIDVKTTMKNKLDIDFRPYTILGACNPPLAHRALTINPDVGMMLPCNVTVAEEEDGRILVSLIDPVIMMPDPALHEVAEDAGVRLKRVADSLRS